MAALTWQAVVSIAKIFNVVEAFLTLLAGAGRHVANCAACIIARKALPFVTCARSAQAKAFCTLSALLVADAAKARAEIALCVAIRAPLVKGVPEKTLLASIAAARARFRAHLAVLSFAIHTNSVVYESLAPMCTLSFWGHHDKNGAANTKQSNAEASCIKILPSINLAFALFAEMNYDINGVPLKVA